MTTIWKFQLQTVDYQEIRVPEGSRALSAQKQDNMLCIWVNVYPNVPRTLYVPHKILIYGTGAPMFNKSDVTYLSTVQDGELVWHIFVDKKLTNQQGETNG